MKIHEVTRTSGEIRVIMAAEEYGPLNADNIRQTVMDKVAEAYGTEIPMMFGIEAVSTAYEDETDNLIKRDFRLRRAL